MRRSVSRRIVASVHVLVVATIAVSSCATDDAARRPGPGEETDGERLYAATCASCHGADLRGSAVGPSQLSEVYEPGHHSDDSYRAAIRNGAPAHHWEFGAMPAFPGLSDEQITALIAFIRSVQEREGFEPYPPD